MKWLRDLFKHNCTFRKKDVWNLDIDPRCTTCGRRLSTFIGKTASG